MVLLKALSDQYELDEHLFNIELFIFIRSFFAKVTFTF